MKVYLLIKESYGSYDNFYDTTVQSFIDRESALNYLAIEKESKIEEAMREVKVSTIEELENSSYVYDFDNRDDYYYIDIEDWGYDCLKIVEQDMMEFKI